MLEESRVAARALGGRDPLIGVSVLRSERVDALPLLIAHLDRMGLPELAGRHLAAPPGRDTGWGLTLWLAALLAAAPRPPADLAGWLAARAETLRRLPAGPYPRGLDGMALPDAARLFHDDARWAAFAAALDMRLHDRFGLDPAAAEVAADALRQAQAARAQLHARITRAREAIMALNRRRRGKFTAVADLRRAVDALLAEHDGARFLNVEYREVVWQRMVRRYRGRPAVTRIERSIRVEAEIDAAALDEASWRLGWWVYAATAPTGALSVTRALLAYRSACLAACGADLLAGVFEPESGASGSVAAGVVRLLGIGARALALLEHLARAGGGPADAPAWPAACGERLLGAFDGITLTLVQGPYRIEAHLTPLSPEQERLLALLGLPPDVYTRLADAPAW